MDGGLGRRIEDASLRAWPALESEQVDGWEIRSSLGFTKRANSVQPFAPSTRPLLDKVVACEAWYDAREMPTIFRLTRFSDQGLDALLEDRGYQLVDRTDVLFTPIVRPWRPLPDAEFVELELEDWLSIYAECSGADRSALGPMGAILQRTLGRHVLAALTPRSSSDRVACGVAVLDHDLLGLFDLATAVPQRRRGYGAAIMAHLVDWGLARGAHGAYLQVVRGNAPALALYRKLGFVNAYAYWYRVRAVAVS